MSRSTLRAKPPQVLRLRSRWDRQSSGLRFWPERPHQRATQLRRLNRSTKAMSADFSIDVDYWTKLEDGRVECRLCPRFCKMRPGQRGLCFVRRAREDGGGMELTSYGRSTGLCVDPDEEKPLNHFP